MTQSSQAVQVEGGLLIRRLYRQLPFQPKAERLIMKMQKFGHMDLNCSQQGNRHKKGSSEQVL